MIGAVSRRRADEADARHHALAHRLGVLGHGVFARIGHRAAGNALRRRDLVRVVAPAVVEHVLVAPLVAVLLEERGEEGKHRVFGLGRRLRKGCLEPLHDRRGVLDARALWRDDQRHERQPRMGVVFGPVLGRARQPVMRDALVAEPAADLHRIGRKLRTENAIARHGQAPPCCEDATMPASPAPGQGAWPASAASPRHRGWRRRAAGCGWGRPAGRNRVSGRWRDSGHRTPARPRGASRKSPRSAGGA